MELRLAWNLAWSVTLWLAAAGGAVWLARRRPAAIRRAICRGGLAGVPVIMLATVAYGLWAPAAGLWARRAPHAEPAPAGPAAADRDAGPDRDAGLAFAAVDTAAPQKDPSPAPGRADDAVEIAAANEHVPQYMAPAAIFDSPTIPAPAPATPPARPMLKTGPTPSPVAARPTAPAPAVTDAALPWPWLLGGTLAVSAALAFRLASRLLQLWRWRRSWRPAGAPWRALAGRLARRTGLARPVKVMTADRLTAPAVAGVFRPALVLPARLPARLGAGLRGVLTHELGHLAGRDPAWNVISAAVTAVAWWCPLLWLLRRREQIDSELAADDYALASGARPVSLARSLLRFAERARPAPVAVAVSGMGRHLKRRIKMILDEDVSHSPVGLRRRGRWMLTGVAALIAAAVVLTPLVGLAEGEREGAERRVEVRRERVEPEHRPKPPPVQAIRESRKRLKELLALQERCIKAMEELNQLRAKHPEGPDGQRKLRAAAERAEQCLRRLQQAHMKLVHGPSPMSGPGEPRRPGRPERPERADRPVHAEPVGRLEQAERHLVEARRAAEAAEESLERARRLHREGKADADVVQNAERHLAAAIERVHRAEAEMAEARQLQRVHASDRQARLEQAEHRLRGARQAAEQAERRLKEIRRLHKAGKAPREALAEAERHLAECDAQAQLAERQLDELRHAAREGRPAEPRRVGPRRIERQPRPSALEVRMAIGEAERRLIDLRTQAELAELDLGRLKAAIKRGRPTEENQAEVRRRELLLRAALQKVQSAERELNDLRRAAEPR